MLIERHARIGLPSVVGASDPRAHAPAPSDEALWDPPTRGTFPEIVLAFLRLATRLDRGPPDRTGEPEMSETSSAGRRRAKIPACEVVLVGPKMLRKS